MHVPVPRVRQVLSLPIPDDGWTVFVLQTRVLWQEGEHVDFMSTKVEQHLTPNPLHPAWNNSPPLTVMHLKCGELRPE